MYLPERNSLFGHENSIFTQSTISYFGNNFYTLSHQCKYLAAASSPSTWNFIPARIYITITNYFVRNKNEIMFNP